MSPTRIVDLYRRFGPLVYSRLRRNLGDVEAAAEATPETFARWIADEPNPDEQSLLRYLRTLESR